ncbi:pyridoxal phosphate-dependent aminotransferase [Bacteroidetes bacterium endosymbiont of Geopemphigus sp.]|uniref:pyridoxal phosphate-dependent aminotransferase n=1 Tax=Bacteroidetes bacterium endosymbiont of Geopemphigus sp. TaxID=2047937 RepID=UPI000CD1D34F|nr:aminotransferase class I/II-fold pyridoxal phosphate-dependent enzyme [Bacteroidetes bacterium endosymbiont of Geopemphigus sp.]
MKISPAIRTQSIREYYFSKKLREIAQFKSEGKDIINLGIGSPDGLPPHKVIEKMQQAAKNAEANRYQSYIGIKELREAWSLWYKKNYRVSLDTNKEILPLMGSKEGIMHISMAYLQKGDQALVPDPGYPAYTSVTRLTGADVIYYSLTEKNHWIPDLPRLEKENLSAVKMMWINYPHMPTGATIRLNDLEKIVCFAEKHKILLVHDNPYSFILNEQPLSVFQIEGAKEISLELQSLSKSHNMAGWRQGMLGGKKEYLQEVLKVKSQMDSGMYLPLQIGAIEALQHSNEWFESLNMEYQKRRNIIWNICKALELTYDAKSTGLFVWAKLPLKEEDKSWSDKQLYNKNVFITPGSLFGKNGRGYVRFSLCCPPTLLEKAQIQLLQS